MYLKKDIQATGDMVTTMVNSKQARPVDKGSTKDHFNPLYIYRYMVNGIYGMNIDLLGLCVYETIV